MRKELARNSLFSLISLVLPLFVGILFIPNLISELGKERFSFLTLIWSLLGYFSFLDLGIGRTLTKIVAERIRQKKEKPCVTFVRTAQEVVFFVSLIGGFLLFFTAEYFIKFFLKISPNLYNELVSSLKVVSFGIPLVTLISLNRGVLEGFSDFFSSNILQILSGVLLFVFPYLSWKLSSNMLSVSTGVIASRIILLCLSFYFLSQKVSNQKPSVKQKKLDFKMLISHGSWITLGNILAPLMANLDKILLSSLIALEKVVFYSTPMEIITRLWAIPGSVTRVFFPKFAAINNLEDLKHQFRIANQIMGLFIMPACLVLYVFSGELLAVWISKEFALESKLIAQIMLLGVLFNCFNWIPYGWLQATSNVKWSIYIVIVEIPFFFFTFYVLTNKFGILGASVAWSGRLVFDYFLTYIVVLKLQKQLIQEFLISITSISLSLVTFHGCSKIGNIEMKMTVALIITSLFLFLNKSLIKDMIPGLKK